MNWILGDGTASGVDITVGNCLCKGQIAANQASFTNVTMEDVLCEDLTATGTLSVGQEAFTSNGGGYKAYPGFNIDSNITLTSSDCGKLHTLDQQSTVINVTMPNLDSTTQGGVFYFAVSAASSADINLIMPTGGVLFQIPPITVAGSSPVTDVSGGVSRSAFVGVGTDVIAVNDDAVVGDLIEVYYFATNTIVVKAYTSVDAAVTVET